MPQFDIVFEKLKELTQIDQQITITIETADASVSELDEIDELRRVAAEIHEPDPLSFTTT